MKVEKWTLKWAPFVVLFGITIVGEEIANLFRPIVGNMLVNLDLVYFLVGIIAALKTAEIIRRRYPDDTTSRYGAPTHKHG
jgi:uncharacterized membrane protein AbrB (regulator of aidB expression)